MKEKKKFYTEAAYPVGLLTLALGAACMTRADFGLSMVVAPAYILHLKLSQFWSWFSFGMAEYCLQAVLLLVTAVVLGRFRKMYLLSFVTAVLYGFALDMFLWLVGLIPGDGMTSRIAFFVIGMLLCSFGVSMFFHTYMPPEAYELVVKEVSAKFSFDIHKVKTVYDCVSCIVAVVMSFAFFGLWHFEGVKWGTAFCAVANGWTIGRFSRLLEKHFEFKDGTKLRGFIE